MAGKPVEKAYSKAPIGVKEKQFQLARKPIKTLKSFLNLIISKNTHD